MDSNISAILHYGGGIQKLESLSVRLPSLAAVNDRRSTRNACTSSLVRIYAQRS